MKFILINTNLDKYNLFLSQRSALFINTLNSLKVHNLIVSI